MLSCKEGRECQYFVEFVAELLSLVGPGTCFYTIKMASSISPFPLPLPRSACRSSKRPSRKRRIAAEESLGKAAPKAPLVERASSNEVALPPQPTRCPLYCPSQPILSFLFRLSCNCRYYRQRVRWAGHQAESRVFYAAGCVVRVAARAAVACACAHVPADDPFGFGPLLRLLHV